MDTFSPPLNEVVNFLAELMDEGVSLSALNIARSALAAFLDVKKLGKIDIIQRFFKGVFEQKPTHTGISKVTTWDPKIVLDYLEMFSPNTDITLKELTLKVTMLLALLSGQRCQTILCLDLNNMLIEDSKCTFFITKLLKHSIKGRHQKPLQFEAFTLNSNICIVNALKSYISRTQTLRKTETQLLISFNKPHKAVSGDTIKRWLKEVLKKAGVNANYSAHSTRASSTSFLEKSVPIKTILDAAGWTNENTFTNFYKKNITKNFGHAMLSKYCS